MTLNQELQKLPEEYRSQAEQDLTLDKLIFKGKSLTQENYRNEAFRGLGRQATFEDEDLLIPYWVELLPVK